MWLSTATPAVDPLLHIPTLADDVGRAAHPKIGTEYRLDPVDWLTVAQHSERLKPSSSGLWQGPTPLLKRPLQRPMTDANLLSFVALAAQQRSLQDTIGLAESPEAIVALASALGYTIDRQDLREASRDLAASHWPWAGQTSDQRRQFFAEPG